MLRDSDIYGVTSRKVLCNNNILHLLLQAILMRGKSETA